jgi:hypothetical protein
MNHFRVELRDDAGEVWRAQNAIEQALWFRWTSELKSFGHVE